MSAIKQMRCPKCGRLLVKYDLDNNKVLYRDLKLIELSDKENNVLQIICSKIGCETLCDLTPEGLVEAKESTVPPADVKLMVIG